MQVHCGEPFMWRFSLLVAMLLLAGGCWAEDVLYRTQQAVELGSARTDIRLQSKSPAAVDLSDHKSGDPLVLVLSGYGRARRLRQGTTFISMCLWGCGHRFRTPVISAR